MTYKSRRYFVPASLPASQETAKRALQARKKAMKLAPFTYSELIEKINYLVTTKQLNPQTAANRCSVLRAFLRSNHIAVEDVIGEEMRGRFTDCIETFLQDVRDAGRSQRNITNTRAALTPLRQMVLEDDILRALEADKPTPFMQQLKTLTAGCSLKRVANMSKVPYDMFLGWLQGKVPRASSARYVYRVEKYFGMEHGELWKLTGSSHPSRMQPELTATAPIAYRQALGVNNKLEYCLVAPADSPLREQWRNFMVYKTSFVPDLERSSKGQWRVSPLPLGRVSERSWWKYLDGNEVASAHAGWAKVSAYLGWLKLPLEEGGAGLPEAELHTLAWLAVPEYFGPFIEWRKHRAGGMHTTFVPEFLGWVMSLMRAEVGYFPQSGWLRETLPERCRKGSWIEMCERQMKFCRRLTQSMRGQIQVRRDPFEPLNSILDLHEPLEAVVEMIQRMRANRPIAHPVKEAIWARDILLIKLLTSNPLRHRNMAHLTWRSDNTGNLYQKNDGSWHIRWKSVFFKNALGAAGDLDYDAEVHASVWADLERYLFKHRSQLLSAPIQI